MVNFDRCSGVSNFRLHLRRFVQNVRQHHDTCPQRNTVASLHDAQLRQVMSARDGGVMTLNPFVRLMLALYLRTHHIQLKSGRSRSCQPRSLEILNLTLHVSKTGATHRSDDGIELFGFDELSHACVLLGYSFCAFRTYQVQFSGRLNLGSKLPSIVQNKKPAPHVFAKSGFFS